jgi:phage-related protein
MMLSVAWDVDAQEELRRLPSAERRAVMTAVAKLEAFGDRLGGTMVILAVGPEAEHDRRGFDRAVRLAEERLKEIEG